ncbi:MAG TPA: CheR family methyltransferase [Solirubrobacterales bacterium]|nr:CheR family methyltransferase [Solirubrobacterales bacterium]
MSSPLERVAELVERESGIQVKESQMDALVAALGRVSQGMDAEQFLGATEEPARYPVLLGRLIDQVATQETFFMREGRELEAVDWHHLLAAARARGSEQVRVWVSACASGEEAYSVAILATEAFGEGHVPVSILATDISTRALRRSEEAAYSERSIRDLSSERRDRFLIRDGARSVVGGQLRSLVRTRRHNLVLDPAPPAGEMAFDLVLCRNALIYFGPETVGAVVRSLESAVQPGGQLILGASDRLTSSARRLIESARGGAEAAALVPSPAVARRAAGGVSRVLRRPLGRSGPATAPFTAPSPSRDREASEALEAANAGRYTMAIEATARILAADPLNADAYYVRGLSELASDDPTAAVESLRRALYVDPTFALAAFQLARAHDRRGDDEAARRAYARTLRAISRADEHPRSLPEQVDLADIAVACRARLAEAGGGNRLR